MTSQHFKTTINKSGTRTFIAPPFNPNDVWGVKGRHYITGTVNGHAVRGSLGSDGTQYFLPLGAAWRRGCGLDAGAKVDVVLSPEGPQSESLSSDVASALDATPQAKAFFESLATFYRNTYIKWIESAKRPETRTARINEMVNLLKAGKKQK
ncbi:MAG TPA: YdeI/OmpD-associated family protein [Anaerolineales bacterium]|nr:YdeI/OmpD-associated family protein [Anaerolineales bacterium]